MAVREFPPESQSFTLSPSLFYQETHCQCPADSNVLTQVLLQQPGEDRVSVGDEVALPLLVALLQRTEQQLASQSHTLMFPDHSPLVTYHFSQSGDHLPQRGERFIDVGSFLRVKNKHSQYEGECGGR